MFEAKPRCADAACLENHPDDVVQPAWNPTPSQYEAYKRREVELAREHLIRAVAVATCMPYAMAHATWPEDAPFDGKGIVNGRCETFGPVYLDTHDRQQVHPRRMVTGLICRKWSPFVHEEHLFSMRTLGRLNLVLFEGVAVRRTHTPETWCNGW